MKHIFTDIENRLSDQVKDLKYIAQDWGQLSLFDRESPPVKYPCALIDINNGQFTNIGNTVQEGLLTIQISVVDWSQLTSHQAPHKMKDNENRIIDILQKCYVALQGWSGSDDYSGLVRTNTSRILRQDGLRMRTITFTTNWQDISAMRTFQRVTPPKVSIAASFLDK